MLILATLALSVAACGGGKNSHTHNFGEWATTTDAACNATGEKERICSGCNEKEKETIPADISLHKLPTDFTIDTAATCMAVGSKSKTCSVCNTKTEVTEIETLPHTLGEFIIDTPATCEEVGSKSKTCSVCKAKAEVTEIAALGHRYDTYATIDVKSTCINKGLNSKHCTRVDCES